MVLNIKKKRKEKKVFLKDKHLKNWVYMFIYLFQQFCCLFVNIVRGWTMSKVSK